MKAAGIPHATNLPPRSTSQYVLDVVIPAAMALLPPRCDSFEARTMLLAIGFQESGFAARHQAGGPARGFWQFEKGGGVRGVLEHDDSSPLIEAALDILQYDRAECWDAIQHNDVLACVFARLLLWTHPAALPEDERNSWAYYLATWRPGKPHPATWGGNFHRAIAMVAA